MAEVGILRSDERVELIRGELIVKMSPIGPRQRCTPEYWVADLPNDRMLCYSEDAEHYRTVREFHRGDFVAPQLLPDCLLQIDVLLP
jgi:Uma2 family endonuclease